MHKNKALLLFTMLISYIALSIYTPSHIMAMESKHDMHIPKDNCPFIIADNVLCNALTKRDTSILNASTLAEPNLAYNYTYTDIVISFLYLLLFYIFFIFKIKNKSSFLRSALLQKLFSKGILNGKVY